MSEMDLQAIPYLRSGTGNTPKDGGCVLQIIDWISSNGWTDSPSCVHPAFQKLAIAANDDANDVDRQKLVELIPRLMGTNTDDLLISVKIAIFCARKVSHIFETKYPDDARPRLAIEAAELYVSNPTRANANAAANAAAYAANAANAAANAAAYAANAAYAAANAAAYAAYAAYAAANAAAYAAYAAYAAGLSKIEMLVLCLDEFDRLTGRTKYAEPDYKEVCRIMRGGLVAGGV